MNQGATHNAHGHPVVFGVAFFVFFVLAYAFLNAVGATPDATGSAAQNGTPSSVSTAATNPENPVRITAASIGLDQPISNPASADDTVLDQALKLGAVRYPGSALLGAEGTVYLFGHSSYLPVVLNQHYKTFDGIQNLKVGDIVDVYSATTDYRYNVTGMQIVDSTSDNTNLLAQTTGRHLVLSTCDSFSATTTRFVVNADLVGAYALSQ